MKAIDEDYRIQLGWEKAATKKERAYWQRRMDQRDRQERIIDVIATIGLITLGCPSLFVGIALFVAIVV